MSSVMYSFSDPGLGNGTCSCQWDNGKCDVSKSLKSTHTNNPVCFLSYTPAIAMKTCLGWPKGGWETCGAELSQPSCLSWDSLDHSMANQSLAMLVSLAIIIRPFNSPRGMSYKCLLSYTTEVLLVICFTALLWQYRIYRISIEESAGLWNWAGLSLNSSSAVWSVFLFETKFLYL